MKRFCADNTEGYGAADLEELNAVWDRIIEIESDSGITWYPSFLDHLAERLLAAYDIGARGDDLWASTYGVTL